jgi:hypothetical protein
VSSADQSIHQKNTMELQDAVKAARVRKGPAAGIDDTGEFWVIPEPPLIGIHGGDGVGNNASHRKAFLHLRHYRSGHVEAVVRIASWHQNAGDSTNNVNGSGILGAVTAAEVISGLLAREVETCWEFFDPSRTDDLTKRLGGLGIPAAAPSPDEEVL